MAGIRSGNRPRLRGAFGVLLSSLLIVIAAAAEPKKIVENPFPERKTAHEFDGGSGWLNTSGPITLKDLRGKIVILDFWTFCCINCHHILPDLKYLEEKFPNQIVVIGVHTPKFVNERFAENVRSAILRHEISHPVFNDSDLQLWRKYKIKGWPTFVVIDPEGKSVGMVYGENNRNVLEDVVTRLIPFHRAKGTLDESPLRFKLEAEPHQPLRFPGKLVADEAGDRLFISDSSHNRIVVATLDGKLREVIGSGAIGREDGSFDKVEFDHPQGMALVGDMLYVADTGNHLLRGIDLRRKTVSTLAGTGEQAGNRAAGGVGTFAALNSPWDLTAVEGNLFIVMAGAHQIWKYNLEDRLIRPFSGSGREDVLNGSHASAAFGQPSGITNDGISLYVADAEGNAIRKVSLDSSGKVGTLAGTSDLAKGRCLFEYGDRDGKGSEARFQHPLGIARHKGMLYVADSYNHKIKSVDPRSGVVKTELGGGTSENRAQPPLFSEPGGLAFAKGLLYVADTNSHAIRVVDLETKSARLLPIEGLSPPVVNKPAAEEKVPPLAVGVKKIAPTDNLTIQVDVELPKDFKLNKDQPADYRLEVRGTQSLISEDLLGQRVEIEAGDGESIQFTVPLAAKSGSAEVMLTVSYGYCRGGTGGLCKFRTVAWTFPLIISATASDKHIKLTAPK